MRVKIKNNMPSRMIIHIDNSETNVYTASMMNRGFKFKLKPTPLQEKTFRAFSGVCRLVYNLALEQRRDWWREYERSTGSRLNYVAQARELTALRAEVDWIAAVSQTCQQQALRDLDRAYQNFFSGRAGYPSPRKRGVNDAFRFQGREVSVRHLNAKWSVVRLPKIGEVKFRNTRALPPNGTVKNVTVTLAANGWHVTFACECAAPPFQTMLFPLAVGIDRGIANTLTLSTGERLSVPGSLARIERCTRKAQKVLSRRKRGSKRYAKQRVRVAKLRARQSRIRTDWHHKASHSIATRFSQVMLEDLRIKNMTSSAKGTIATPGKNVKAKSGLNRAILNQSWFRFETLLAYKLEERGGQLVKVNPAYTSQTCSVCGAVDRLSRESQARFVCTTCGHHEHADINAAKNIMRRNAAFMPVEDTGYGSVETGTRRLAI